MKCNQITTAFLILGLPTLALASVQQPGSPPKQQPQTPRTATTEEVATYATVSKLIGANVWSRADAEGDRDDIADIKDFVVDAESGKVDFVILSSGGIGSLGDSLRRVNFADLRIEHTGDDECKVTMDKTEDEFDRIAKIDDDALELYSAKAVAASFKDRQAGAREASGDKKTTGAREGQMRASGAILASELDDFDVRATMTSYDGEGKPLQADSLGSIDEAWINTSSGKLEYLTFDHAGRMLVFPHRALVSHVDSDGEGLYFVAPAADRLAAAPAFDEDKNWNLRNSEFRDTINRFYGEMKAEAKETIEEIRRSGNGK